MNGFYFEMFRKHKAFHLTQDAVDINEAIKDRKGKIQEMLVKHIHNKGHNNGYTIRSSKGNNLFNHFQKASKTVNCDNHNNNSKYTTPYKQGKTKSMLMLLSPTKRNNTHRSIESAFASTKCTLFSSHSKHMVHTKSINVLSQFNTLAYENSNNNNKYKRNVALTLTSPGVSRTQSMFYTITTQCKQQYKRGLNISTSITNKYKRNTTQTRSKHIYKGNKQDIQALTENITVSNSDNDDLNTKQIVNIDIKHVDKLSNDSVYKNRNLYVNSLSHDNTKHERSNNGVSIYNTATHNNYARNRSLYIKHLRQVSTQKSFYIVERLLRLNTKYKDKLIKLTKRISSNQQQHKHRLQSA